ncbi:MAG: type II toxin-antitoxin system VapC family toxin [Propionibacteriaceae bacterium]|nr:type II toxin-antitoxin system VapC family toxin [Propionibacteriaceae bacterium]
MASVTLIDSDVLIAHLRGIEAARVWLKDVRTRSALAVSVLTVTEIVGGMRSAERHQVRTLLDIIPQEPVSSSIAHRAGELMRVWHRSHTGISTVDYVIAATAIEQNMDLATLNIRHYPMFPQLSAPFTLPTLT